MEARVGRGGAGHRPHRLTGPGLRRAARFSAGPAFYAVSSSAAKPPATGWTVYSDGAAPAPIVQML